MNLTEFLERPEKLHRTLAEHQQLLAEMYADRGVVSSPFEDVSVKRSRGTAAPFEGLADSIVDMEAHLAEETKEYRKAFDEAKEFIRSVEPDQDRWLLFERYLLGKSWAAVGAVFGKGSSWACIAAKKVIHNLEPKWAEKGQK